MVLCDRPISTKSIDLRRSKSFSRHAGTTARTASRSGMREHFVPLLTECREMRPVHYVKPDYPADAFAGTASYYARYRVPYPKALIEDLMERIGVSGKGRLLDLACGPGRVVLSLAPRFRGAWAIDLEPEMIEVGQEAAQLRRVDNIRWMVGKAKELEAESASFELITIGEAFHRLDQWHIARQALHWLSPGCCLAIMGCYNIRGGKEPWQRIVANIVDKFASRKSAREKVAWRPQPGMGPYHSRLVQQDAGFLEVDSFSFVQPHVWTVESIVGNMYSTSRCSKKVLGDDAKGFEADLTEALLAHDASGHFRENLRCGYALGRKPS